MPYLLKYNAFIFSFSAVLPKMGKIDVRKGGVDDADSGNQIPLTFR